MKNHQLKRKIHIKDQIWTYEIGKSHVKIRNPDCTKTYTPDMSQLTGLSWDTLERAAWKKTSQANITPSKIRNWINRNT